MSMLPFDASRMKASRSAKDEPMTVTQVAQRISRALDTIPSPIRIRGEISGLRAGTHWYFSLKDSSSVVSCVMFASRARRADVRPSDGDEVVIEAKVDFYAPSGRLSLVVDRISPVGAGALEAQFQALCAELRELGWFDEASKSPLPPLARRVAVITSATGAAIQDVLDTAKRRCPLTDILIVDARVQGDGAAVGLASTIRLLDERRESLTIDAIILTRGGGSREDLWCFNDRDLAKTIRTCSIPIVAAIGHESDTTIAELVADCRAATPTQAVVRLLPDQEELVRQVVAMRQRLDGDIRQRIAWRAERLRSAMRFPLFSSPSAFVDRVRERLELRTRMLDGAMRGRLMRMQGRLDHLAGSLDAHRPATQVRHQRDRIEDRAGALLRVVRARVARGLASVEADARALDLVSPTRVLERGFTLTTRPTGEVIRSASDLDAGMDLDTRFADGVVRSRVEGQLDLFRGAD